MTAIVVPYHHDDRLPDGLVPVPGGGPAVLVDPELPPGDRWSRMAVLHAAVAAAVAGSPSPATVLSGDCLLGLAAVAGAQRAGRQEDAGAPPHGGAPASGPSERSG